MMAGAAFASTKAPPIKIKSPTAAAASDNQADMSRPSSLTPTLYVPYTFLSRTKRVHYSAVRPEKGRLPCQPENRAGVGGAATESRAIEISGAVVIERTLRLGAIRSSGQIMESGAGEQGGVRQRASAQTMAGHDPR